MERILHGLIRSTSAAVPPRCSSRDALGAILTRSAGSRGIVAGRGDHPRGQPGRCDASPRRRLARGGSQPGLARCTVVRAAVCCAGCTGLTPREQVRPAVGALAQGGIREYLPATSSSVLPAELRRRLGGRPRRPRWRSQPEHLSLYGLTVESHTPLGAWIDRGGPPCRGRAGYADEFLRAHDAARRPRISSTTRCRTTPGRAAARSTTAAYWRRAPVRRARSVGPQRTRPRTPLEPSGVGGVRHGAGEQGVGPVAGRSCWRPAALRLEELYLGLRTDRWSAPSSKCRPSSVRWMARRAGRSEMAAGSGSRRRAGSGSMRWSHADLIALQDHPFDRV